jgi:hypothetical protein
MGEVWHTDTSIGNIPTNENLLLLLPLLIIMLIMD